MTLQSALEIARLIESVDRQTKGIENSTTANKNGENLNAVQKGKKKLKDLGIIEKAQEPTPWIITPCCYS